MLKLTVPTTPKIPPTDAGQAVEQQSSANGSPESLFIGNDGNPPEGSQAVHHDRQIGASKGNGGLPVEAGGGGKFQEGEETQEEPVTFAKGEAPEKIERGDPRTAFRGGVRRFSRSLEASGIGWR